MIQVRFEELRLKESRKRGVTRISLQQMAEETGLSFATLQRLSTNTNKGIEYSTLNALCAYFQVQSISELMEYIPDNGGNSES